MKAASRFPFAPGVIDAMPKSLQAQLKRELLTLARLATLAMLSTAVCAFGAGLFVGLLLG